MDEKISHEIEKFKILYYDIINGFSYSEKENVYIKHLQDSENGEIINKKYYFIEKFSKDGIPKFKEKLEQLIKDGEWAEKDEDEILELQWHISDNEKNIQTIIPQQRPIIQDIIDNKKKQLIQKLRDRKILIGSVCEDFAENKCENYFLFYTLYKDDSLKQKLFLNYEELENLDFSDIKKYFDIVNSKLLNFNENNIYKIAVMPFFLNIFSYCKDNLYTFLNKPISKLTQYQVLLLSLGQRNLNVLSQAEGRPPDMLKVEDIDEIVKFYDMEHSIVSGKRGGKPMGITKTSREIVTNSRN